MKFFATCEVCGLTYESGAKSSVMMAILQHTMMSKRCAVDNPAELDDMIWYKLPHVNDEVEI